MNLLGRAVPRNADGAEMVAARERFLGSGAYDAGRRRRSPTPRGGRPSVAAPTVLDVGAGPGWYLDRVLAGLAAAGREGRGVALDVSPAAARRAARSRGGSVRSSPTRGPGCRSGRPRVDVALSVFAPASPASWPACSRPAASRWS